MSKLKQNNKYMIFLTIVTVLVLIPFIIDRITNHLFNEYLSLPNAEHTIIDIKHYDSSLSFSLNNNDDKQKLLDLIQNNIRFSKGKIKSNQLIDSLHNTYSIIIWSTDASDYSCVLYVSSKEPQYCFFAGQYFKYFITGGNVITNYLDEYMNTLQR